MTQKFLYLQCRVTLEDLCSVFNGLQCSRVAAFSVYLICYIPLVNVFFFVLVDNRHIVFFFFTCIMNSDKQLVPWKCTA